MDYNRDCKCVKYDVWCKYFFPPFLYNHFCLCVEKNLIHASGAVNVTNTIYVWTVMIGSRFK
jgi:5'(3')-deoxyribonucleotidase